MQTRETIHRLRRDAKQQRVNVYRQQLYQHWQCLEQQREHYSEKVINKVLDLVSGSQQMDLLQTFYETTLVALQVCGPVAYR